MRKNHFLVPLLIAGAMAAPTAFAQVLGGGVNIGGGAGVQAGPLGIGAGGQARGDIGVRTDAVRAGSRRAHDLAARTRAQGQAAAATGVSAAHDNGARVAGVASGTAQAAAATGASASGQALSRAAMAGSGSVGIDASGSLGAQGAASADDRAGAAVSGNASAAANSAVTAGGQGEASQADANDAAASGPEPTRAERKAARASDRRAKSEASRHQE